MLFKAKIDFRYTNFFYPLQVGGDIGVYWWLGRYGTTCVRTGLWVIQYKGYLIVIQLMKAFIIVQPDGDRKLHDIFQ